MISNWYNALVRYTDGTDTDNICTCDWCKFRKDKK